MAAPAKTHRAGTPSAIPPFCAAATSALLALGAWAPSAWAQSAPSPPTQVVIDQVQLGDVLSNQTLTVTSSPAGASISSTTVANSGLASVDNGGALNYQATQQQGGKSVANTNLSFADNAGSQLYVQTSATGNTGTAGVAGGALTGSTTQTVDAYQTVTAQTNIYIGGPAPTGLVSVDSAAVGNDQGWEANGGSVAATSIQTQYGETYATLGANVAAVSGPASYSATAVGNNVTSDATDASATLTVNQSADGFRTRADLDVTQQSGSDITAASTATSNNINVTSDSYPASLTSTQFNTNPVQAEVDLTAGTWTGAATVSSYGVANSAIVSNAGPSTTVDGTQTNTGEVSATANFNGGSSSGDSTVLSTAVGNAYSAYACPDCNGVVNANLRQTSSGGVSSTTSVTTSSSGYISGASAAVGNTATFQVKK